MLLLDHLSKPQILRSLLKKIDVFSTEKNTDKRHKMALFRALNVASWAVQG